MPLPLNVVKLRIVDTQLVLEEFKIPEVGPDLELKWDPSNENLKGMGKVSWEVTHQEGVPIKNMIYRITKDKRWYPIILPSQ